jgi:hypothetical protein
LKVERRAAGYAIAPGDGPIRRRHPHAATVKRQRLAPQAGEGLLQ